MTTPIVKKSELCDPGVPKSDGVPDHFSEENFLEKYVGDFYWFCHDKKRNDNSPLRQLIRLDEDGYRMLDVKRGHTCSTQAFAYKSIMNGTYIPAPSVSVVIGDR